MSHHFDSPTAREDGRLDLTDFFCFRGELRDHSVFVIMLAPDAGNSSPAEFRADAGLYELKVDTDGDGDEDVAIRLRFGDALDGSQPVEVRLARGKQARSSADGEAMAVGRTEQTLALAGGGRAFTGLAADPFFANGLALGAFLQGIGQGRFDISPFTERPDDAFAGRDAMAIVLELPHALFGGVSAVRAWAAISLVGHAPQRQVNRIAKPLITSLFFGSDERSEAYAGSHPRDDRALYGEEIAATAAAVARAAGTTRDPDWHGRLVAETLLPDVLEYRLGSPGQYGFAVRDGRSLGDDVMDVTISLVANAPVADGASPPAGASAESWPYVARPHRRGGQALIDLFGLRAG